MKRLVILLAHLLLLRLWAESPEALLSRFQGEGLPAAPLQERLREGLAKGVSDEMLTAALHNRAESLKQARELLQMHNYPLTAPPVQELWVTLARVLETGMPPQQVQALLIEAKGQSAGRLSPLLEVGDSLRLSGIDDESAHLLLMEFFQRGLSRAELLRASRTARQLFAEGLRGEVLRQRLLEGTDSPRRNGNGPKGPPEGRGGHGRQRGGR